MKQGSGIREQGFEIKDRVAEPWLRGTLAEVEPVRRAVLHALELAGEDAERWAAELSDGEMFARPAGLPSVAFHVRHMVRSLDRLLTYAESASIASSQTPDRQPPDCQPPVLSESQRVALRSEMEDEGSAAEVLAEFREGLRGAMERVRAIAPETLGAPRGVGRKRLPTTVAGLLVHCAEHTQRHVGQMVTTVKVVRGKSQD